MRLGGFGPALGWERAELTRQFKGRQRGHWIAGSSKAYDEKVRLWLNQVAALAQAKTQPIRISPKPASFA
jgi:hypothetical protein